ncbi:hypothetical protein GmHk_10G028818 [Glycine max]|nr:hypothetical protein GmHk_10G028818 [Glycine max]
MASEIVNRVDYVDDIEFMEDEEEARVEPKPNAKENRRDNDEKESKKVKVCTSIAWKYFTKIGVVDGKEKAECNACGQQYVIGGSKVDEINGDVEKEEEVVLDFTVHDSNV